MLRLLIFFFCVLLSGSTLGQVGTSGDPFNSFKQAWDVPSSGIYYFNIIGTAFSTYVEAGAGWMLMASGSSSTSESSYTTTSSLTLQSDAILPASIYTSSSIMAVRMNSTSGPATPFDVNSSDAGVLANLQSNQTLSANTNDTDWTGTGTARLARSCAGNSSPLNTYIYHGCGNTSSLHWQVGKNADHEKVNFSSGAKNDLNLWIRQDTFGSNGVLPIELIDFNAKSLQNQTVLITWQVASETNNDYFTVETTKSGLDWKEVQKVDGAGNSQSRTTYSIVDQQPNSGVSYYRLRQTDFDGTFTYSKMKRVNLNATNNVDISIYPNPTEGVITVVGSEEEIKNISIYNARGQDVTQLVTKQFKSQTAVSVDLQKLASGMYFVKTETIAKAVYKQ